MADFVKYKEACEPSYQKHANVPKNLDLYIAAFSPAPKELYGSMLCFVLGVRQQCARELICANKRARIAASRIEMGR